MRKTAFATALVFLTAQAWGGDAGAIRASSAGQLRPPVVEQRHYAEYEKDKAMVECMGKAMPMMNANEKPDPLNPEDFSFTSERREKFRKCMLDHGFDIPDDPTSGDDGGPAACGGGVVASNSPSSDLFKKPDPAACLKP